jgi:hypothetical protein
MVGPGSADSATPARRASDRAGCKLPSLPAWCDVFVLVPGLGLLCMGRKEEPRALGATTTRWHRGIVLLPCCHNNCRSALQRHTARCQPCSVRHWGRQNAAPRPAAHTTHIRRTYSAWGAELAGGAGRRRCAWRDAWPRQAHLGRPHRQSSQDQAEPHARLTHSHTATACSAATPAS